MLYVMICHVTFIPCLDLQRVLYTQVEYFIVVHPFSHAFRKLSFLISGLPLWTALLLLLLRKLRIQSLSVFPVALLQQPLGLLPQLDALLVGAELVPQGKGALLLGPLLQLLVLLRHLPALLEVRRVPGRQVLGDLGPREGAVQLDRHGLDGRGPVDAVVHLGPPRPPLRQLRPHTEHRHIVRV